MKTGDVMHFRTIEELQSSIDKQLEELKKKADEYSKTVGDKIRTNEGNQSEDLAELKEKLQGPTDPKKKQPSKKKDQKKNWYDMGAISVYDGIGVKGELELYFQALDEIKSNMESLQKTKEAISGLVSRGLRKDLGYAALMRHNLPFEVTLLKSDKARDKFSYKAIFSVETEPVNNTIA
ncbi:MAG: hypothetical protein WD033_05900 [Nitrosopumilaceae archaeon]